MPPAKKPRPTLDVDEICDRISNGEAIRNIAKGAGLSMRMFYAWVDEVPERSMRIRDVRRQSAHALADKAEDVIEEATTPFELARANSLAHHYRWKAKMVNPREYGDKITHEGSEDNPVVVKADLTLGPSEAYLRMLGK